MVPDSLESGASSTSLRLSGDEGGGNPCADADDFFDCQPNLLKLYIGISRQMVGMVNEVIQNVSSGLFGNISISSIDDATVEECSVLETGESEVSKVHYCVTTDKIFSVILESPSGPFMYLNVADNQYRVQYDGANDVEDSGDEDDGGGPSKIDTTITYTSADAFDISLTMAEMGCEADDVAAPHDVVIKIGVEDSVWQGKAMMYHPRWMGQDLTCNSDPTDTTAIGIYSDFVGNDTNTTAAIYLMPRTISDVADFADYTLADICTNYNGGCNESGVGFGSQNVLATSYQNNLCADASGASWGGNCSSDVDAIANGTFSEATNWITPSDLQNTSVTLPTSLE